MTVPFQVVCDRQKSFGFARVAAATFWTKPMGVSKNLEKHLEMARHAGKDFIQGVFATNHGVINPVELANYLEDGLVESLEMSMDSRVAQSA